MEPIELLCRMHEVLDRLQVPHVVVGSMASMLYGEPRFTRDVDFVLDLPASQVDAFCKSFPAPEYYVSTTAAAQAVRDRGQFNVIHILSGYKVDLILSKPSNWSRHQLKRGRPIVTESGVVVNTAAPEDIILGKLQYYQAGGSEKHLRDIVAMLDVSGDQIDRDDIERWAKELGVLPEWNLVVERLRHP